MAARIALVVAMAENGVIGQRGKLPWHLPEDLKHFKAITVGKTVLMGRRTFESIGAALPERRNLVLTSGTRPLPAGVERIASIEAALLAAGEAAELCVIGGATLYAQTLPRAARIYLTRVHATVGGDVHFPVWDATLWREIERREHPADARHAYAMSFVTLER